MNSSNSPLVSIGMPVYNGERFVREALNDLVAQDHRNFELFISDNASTDATEQICREFQAADPRIRYVRHAENRGAVWNFEFVARQAQGEYFMWAGHDDRWAPSYIRKCVEALEAHPEAVLCSTEINFINAAGLPSPQYVGYKNMETLGMTPVQRIHALIDRLGWFAIYGVIRREAVTRLPLDLSVYGADVILLLALLLEGNFAKLSEPLFSSRIVIHNKTAEDYQRQFNSSTPATAAPYTSLAINLLEAIYRSALSTREKTEVFADFIVTLTWNNPPWRRQICQELFDSAETHGDQQFAFLLTLLLARVVPLDEGRQNPFVQALYHSPFVPQDVLRIARQVLRLPDSFTPPSYEERYQRGIQLFEQERFEEASTLIGESLKNCETADRWSDWATARLACDHVDEAERGFLRALWMDAHHGPAAAKLGILLATQGRTQEAIGYLERSAPQVGDPERAAILELLENCRGKREQAAAPVTG